MRFYFHRRFLGVLLLLVALTCTAQGSGLRARRFVFDKIGSTFNNIIEKTIEDINTIFKGPTTTEWPEYTTESTFESETDETSPDYYREIINAPIRCPPNHVMVKKRCRMVTRRR